MENCQFGNLEQSFRDVFILIICNCFDCRHDNQTVNENLYKYLANQYAPGSSYYPSDPQKRAKIDSLLNWDQGIVKHFDPRFFGQEAGLFKRSVELCSNILSDVFIQIFSRNTLGCNDGFASSQTRIRVKIRGSRSCYFRRE